MPSLCQPYYKLVLLTGYNMTFTQLKCATSVTTPSGIQGTPHSLYNNTSQPTLPYHWCQQKQGHSDCTHANSRIRNHAGCSQYGY